MPGSTPIHSLPYMVDTDPMADVAQAIEDLAAALEDRLSCNGTAVLALAAAASGSVAVVFPVGKFAAAPRVMATVNAGVTPYVVSVSAITAAGCNLNIRHADNTAATANVSVMWSARKASA